MNRRQWMILAAIGVVAAFVAWLAWSSRQPPLLPNDEIHRTVASAGVCMGCHGADGAVPQSPRHPLGQECFRCHGSR
jgi:cytochrome c553